jgi:hypothetical protein
LLFREKRAKEARREWKESREERREKREREKIRERKRESGKREIGETRAYTFESCFLLLVATW